MTGEIPICEFCGRTVNIQGYYVHTFRRHDGVSVKSQVCLDCERVPPPKIVCLVGSTKFVDDFNAVGFNETMKGNMVLTLAQHVGSDDELGITPKQKQMLDRLHIEKIKIAHEVLVINRDGYIGPSTAREILYAQRLGKPVRYLYETRNSDRIQPGVQMPRVHQS